MSLKSFLAAALTIAALSFPSNASDFELGGLTAYNLSAATLIFPPAPKAAAGAENVNPAQPETKEWTVMIYLVGTSDLEGDGFSIINQMERLGSNADLNIIAEWGRMSGQPSDSVVDGNWTGARVYYVTQDDNTRKLSSRILKEINAVDMGSPRHLAGFINWSKQRFPARKYMLVICSHGSGWYYGADSRAHDTRGTAFDDGTNNFIDTPALGRLLKESGPLDILLNDSCLLQGLEVLYEVKDSVKIMMGAENFAYDQDYYTLMKRFHANPAVSPRDLSLNILSDYRKYYAGSQKDGYDLSALEASAAEGLVRLLDKWTALVIKTDDTDAVSAAKKSVKRFYYTHYADLRDFIEIYNSSLDDTLTGAAKTREAGENIIAYLEKELVIGHVHGGAPLSKLHGISIQMPGPKDPAADYRNDYSKLAVSRASGWAVFMEYVDSVKQNP